MVFILCLEMLFLIVVLLLAGKKYASFVKENAEVSRLRLLAPVPLYLLDRLRIFDRFPKAIAGIHYKMIALFGSRQAIPYSKMYVAQMFSVCFLLFTLCTGLGAAADGDMLFLVYGLVLAIFVPFLMIKDLDRKIRRRKQQMLFLLPEFLNKLVLLVNAGETVQKAMVRCTESASGSVNDNPLMKELRVLAAQLDNNYSFPLAMEELSKRCCVQEVTIFTTTVLLNYRRGGENFVLALRNLSRDLWEKRKALTRTLGEEASSKLVFPMVLIFLIVMVVVAAPAILMMNY